MAATTKNISSLKSMGTFLKLGTCSESLCHIMNREFNNPLDIEMRGAMPLAGGIMQHGYQCGMLWGTALAAGAEAHKRFGPGPKAETAAILAAQRLVKSFRNLTNEINCLEITDLDNNSSTMKMIYVFLIKGGTIGCLKMAAKFAPIAYDEIDTALSDNNIDVPPSPVSCTSLLAKKAGLTDMQVTMAAGLAGGIGLSGGACGALGAAIWILAMKLNQEGNSKIKFKDPRAMQLIEKFLQQSGYKFECSEICGKTFKDVNEHASHLCEGKCNKLIDLLATECQ
ncbi:MAG: C-GCAxxG-C-C family protein [Fibrobacteria bacterium]|nr:C-GCAxxG-C-C family protein [Fibrobacteria bacterium]